ncbi:MAG: hypothetical protein SWH61_02565 [Thermodesulfobacteriota bacterium]|nr:hypothetical protein [Thermodesulfobacteriota bacterium]
MHLYWRIQQDLSCLKEVIQFHDPSLIREMRRWVQQHFAGLLLAEGLMGDGTIPFSRN